MNPKEYPKLPDEVKDMVTLVEHDNSEVKNALRNLKDFENAPIITTSVKRDAKGYPLKADGTIDWAKASEEKEAYAKEYESKTIKRKQSNRKVPKRKKAKNGRTKKRRK